MCNDPRVGRHSHGEAGRLIPVRPGLLITVLSAAGISVSLMQTLVIPLVPELPRLLDAAPSNTSWAITATLLTGAVATPMLGRLGDMYGPKPILIACALMLTAGSLTAALTTSLLPLIVGRGLQGFGMPIIPLGISVLRASIPAERVGGAMGLMSASLGVGGALGLPLSALIAQTFNWHALFWVAAGLGAAGALSFIAFVPRIAATSADPLDPLGAVGLAAGLVTLLLPISKGGDWGWTSPLTLGMFGASPVVFAVFAWWQFRVPAPTVDLRTTLRRPVLATNLASIALGFGMFAMTLVGPQILELPTRTGVGLGQSMLATGLWMAPGGLAMMLSAPLAARIAAVRGPRFTLLVGTVIVGAGYLAGHWLLAAPWQLSVLNLVISVGVGFAFSSLPALINGAVPMSETAAANGINALARSLGTSISSAVTGAVLAGMTITVAGEEFPSLRGVHTVLLIAVGAAVIAGVFAFVIPVPAERAPVRRRSSSSAGPYPLLSRLEAAEMMSIEGLAAELGFDTATVSRQIATMLRAELVARVPDAFAGRPRYTLTAAGQDRLRRHRMYHKAAGRRPLAAFRDRSAPSDPWSGSARR